MQWLLVLSILLDGGYVDFHHITHLKECLIYIEGGQRGCQKCWASPESVSGVVYRKLGLGTRRFEVLGLTWKHRSLMIKSPMVLEKDPEGSNWLPESLEYRTPTAKAEIF